MSTPAPPATDDPLKWLAAQPGQTSGAPTADPLKWLEAQPGYQPPPPGSLTAGKPAPEFTTRDQGKTGPNVTPGVTDDELIRSFGADPDVIKKSPAYQESVKNTGSGFGDYITKPGSTQARILGSSWGSPLMGISDIAAGGAQAMQHGLAKLGFSKEDTPYYDLLQRVWDENYKQNVLGGQEPGTAARIGRGIGEALPGLVLGGAGAGAGAGVLPTIAAGAGSGALTGAVQPVTVTPQNPYYTQKAGQIGAGAVVGGALGVATGAGQQLWKAFGPGIAKAAATFDNLEKTIGGAPVDVSGPEQVLAEAQKLEAAGQKMPDVFTRFIDRITNPQRGPLTWEEARKFYSTVTDLSAQERLNLTNAMKGTVKTFTKSLGESLENGAEQAQPGLGQVYADAIKAYRQGMQAKTWAGETGKEMLKKALPYSVGTGGGAAGLWWLIDKMRGKAEGGPILDRYPSRESILTGLSERPAQKP